MKRSYAGICKEMSKENETFHCEADIQEMEKLIERADADYDAKVRQPKNVLSRSKRNNKGLFHEIWDMLLEFTLGSNSPDPNTSATSAGIMVHEALAVKEVEGKLAEKQQLVEKSLSSLSTAMKSDEKSLQNEIMDATKRLQLMELRYKIFDTLHAIVNVFDLKRVR